jgi:hypothetical protein
MRENANGDGLVEIAPGDAIEAGKAGLDQHALF